MIGAFARMLGSRSRVLSVEEDHTIRAREERGYAEHRTSAPDAPPEAFVEKVADEGGDVYVMPFMDALRAALRGKRADPSKAEPEATSTPNGTARP